MLANKSKGNMCEPVIRALKQSYKRRNNLRKRSIYLPDTRFKSHSSYRVNRRENKGGEKGSYYEDMQDR